MVDPDESLELVRRAGDGDMTALDDFFARYRQRLRRMVELRLNRRIQARVDASDIVQDAFLQASKGLADYLAEPKLPPFLWLRHLTGLNLLAVHRKHLGTGIRDAAREISIDRSAIVEADTTSMAIQILSQASTPSGEAVRDEERQRLQQALDGMDPADREIIALRHFEELSNVEAARVLGISESAASSRFFRALGRLNGLLSDLGLGDA